MPKDNYLESRVLSADPVELIHLLYEHALHQVGCARAALAAQDIIARSKAITKALEVIGELEGSLDYSAGGAISVNLAKLYRYIRRRLVEGNVNREDAPLAEAESLLGTLGEGWSAMRHTVAHPVTMPYSQMVTDPAAHAWSA